jgi:hypothetical protein
VKVGYLMAEGLLPHEPGEISLAWLAQVLQRNTPNYAATIRTMDVENVADGSGYSGEVARWRLQYDEADPDAPASIIVKSANRDPQVRLLMMPLVMREVFFYKTLAHQIGVPHPIATMLRLTKKPAQPSYCSKTLAIVYFRAMKRVVPNRRRRLP